MNKVWTQPADKINNNSTDHNVNVTCCLLCNNFRSLFFWHISTCSLQQLTSVGFSNIHCPNAAEYYIRATTQIPLRKIGHDEIRWSYCKYKCNMLTEMWFWFGWHIFLSVAYSLVLTVRMAAHTISAKTVAIKLKDIPSTLHNNDLNNFCSLFGKVNCVKYSTTKKSSAIVEFENNW